jgi:hypothetical protein
MCVCVCVCVCVHMHTYINININIYIYIHKHTYTYIYIHIYIYIRKHTSPIEPPTEFSRTFTRSCTYIHTYVFHAHKNTYWYAHMCNTCLSKNLPLSLPKEISWSFTIRQTELSSRFIGLDTAAWHCFKGCFFWVCMRTLSIEEDRQTRQTRTSGTDRQTWQLPEGPRAQSLRRSRYPGKGTWAYLRTVPARGQAENRSHVAVLSPQ